MVTELEREYQKAREKFNYICNEEIKILTQKKEMETVLSYFEIIFSEKKQYQLNMVNKPPLNDIDEVVNHNVRLNKIPFLIKIITKKFNGEFSSTDLINVLKKEYSTFDLNKVQPHLDKLVEKSILFYDNLQYKLTKTKRRRRNSEINVSKEVEYIIDNELGSNSLSFDVKTIYDIISKKFPADNIRQDTVSSRLIKLAKENKLKYIPGKSRRERHIYSVK
jgi:hypothetical protein